MAFRTWALASAVLGLVSAAGCSLPRGALNGGAGNDSGMLDAGHGGFDTGVSIDSGTLIDAGRDAAATCTTSCDDGTPCTDDACDTTGTCTHTPNSAACNDGVFCNGADTCGGGTCSVHDGVSPCASPLTCDAVTDMCVGCTRNSDCPAPIDGAWGACDFGTDLCATTGGTHTRSVMTFTCHSGACTPATTTGSEACTRPSTDGTMCAAPTYGSWSTCDFGTDPCTQMGTQARTTTTSTCSGGVCSSVDGTESQGCVRPSTDGTPCGMPTTGPWSVCMVGAACATSGTQTRLRTNPTCGSGTCATMMSTEMQACVPATITGSACGATVCGGWSACAQTTPGTCDRTGTQSRICATPTCSAGGGCSDTSTTTEMQACSASVSGVSCTTMSCGACHEGTGTGCRSGHTGTRRCSTTSGTCMDWGSGPFCAGLPVYSNPSCACP